MISAELRSAGTVEAGCPHVDGAKPITTREMQNQEHKESLCTR
jgi:hypothetical protein